MASSFSSPWPDPNSSVLSKIDFGVPLVELFKWLDVRDTLLGENFKKQDITAALALARDCKHPDAEWLTSIFEGKDVSTKEDARKVFLSFENDARALCFAWWMGENREKDLTLIRCAALMGYAFAVSSWEWQCGLVEEFIRLNQLAVAQHERDGFYDLAHHFRSCFYIGKIHGEEDCEEDWNLAKENHCIAAELGHVYAAANYGAFLDESDAARWLWWSRAALHGLPPRSFLGSFPEEVKQFFCGSGNATIVFLIGRSLKGNIDAEKKQIFGSDDYFDSRIGPANQAVSFYDPQIKCARLAVDTWTLLSTRLHIMKDMRIYIGKMIWEARFEANYEFDLDEDDASSVSSLPTNEWSASSPVLKRSRK